VKGTINGHCGDLLACRKSPTKHELSVGTLVAAAAMAHKHERHRALVLSGGPENPWHDAGLALEVESALRNSAFTDRLTNPSQ
jgi:hypothetical protein